MRITLRLVGGLAVVLLAAVLARKKKKTPPDGSDNGGMFTCTDVYVYGYFNGTAAAGGTFYGWDNGQVADTDEAGVQVQMLDKNVLNGICTPIAYMSDGLAEIEVGDPSLGEPMFYSWINFNKKNLHYGYKQPFRGGPTPANRSEDTTWEGGTARADQVNVVTTDVTDSTTGIRTVTETTTEVITLTTEEIIATKYRPDSQLQDNWDQVVYRRSGTSKPGQEQDKWEEPVPSSRRLLGEEDEGPLTVEVTNLPDLPDSCGEGGDPNHPMKSELDHPTPVCASREFDWACEMTNIEAVTARMKELTEIQADDCWTINQWEAKCEGAPLGPQICTLEGDAIASNEYVVGVKITVNGDRCRACSLNEELCPNYYDVHSCTYEFIKTTNRALAAEGYYDEDGESRDVGGDGEGNDPNQAGEFKIVYEINAGPAAASASLLMSMAAAFVVLFLSVH